MLFALAAEKGSAQEFTLTTTNANVDSSKALIDMPGLTANPLAIIIATPLGNTALLNTHPVGAWYYSGKWNIFNSDHAVMPLGAKYRVQFFKEPGPNQFMHLVTQQNIGAEGSYIDNPALNNNPDAQVKIFQNYAPEVRTPYYLDRFKSEVAYSTAAGRWYIANVNGEALGRGTVFNVVITPGTGVGTTPATNPGTNSSVSPEHPPSKIDALPAPTGQTLNPVAPSTPGGVPLPVKQQTQKSPIRANWTLRPEPSPQIGPNSDILLFIHGMDSRAEEAEDITKALFTLKANPPGPAPPPPSGTPTPNPQLGAELKRILQKYEGCILERYETKDDLRRRGLNVNLSRLQTTSGLQDRDAGVVCVAGNLCSLAFRRASHAKLLAQASRGDATNFETDLKKAIPRDCFDCQPHQERHTKHVHCTMECGGNNGVDVFRADNGPGPCFEVCKFGEDIMRLVADVVNDIHLALTIPSGPPPLSTNGTTIATNFSTVQFKDCPNPAEGCPESCDHPDNFSQGARSAVLPYDSVNGRRVELYFPPPANMLDTKPPLNTEINLPPGRNLGTNEGRLLKRLRDAAASREPLYSLSQAASEFALQNEAMGNAFADLSVTGHRAFDDFRKALPNESFCQALAQTPTRGNGSDLLNGCHRALDRAYAVANFLRTGQRADTPAEKTRKLTERDKLGWIAVSGEDDSPHRPVNVPSSDYPQYDIDVVVDAPLAAEAKSVTVRTRYVIAQSGPMGTTGKNLVVISLDLPTSGYSENLDYDRVSPLTEIGKPITTQTNVPPKISIPDFQPTGNTPLLDFIENFIVHFAETLDQQKYLNKNDFKAVMGGSLGGNMTFRLGRLPGVAWLPNFVVWSPASIWDSLGEGTDPLKHLGPRKAWEGADLAHQSPSPGDRAKFFGSWDKPIVEVIIPMAQSDTWTSDYYPCKKSAVAAARLDRHETYDARFLAWHWRLGAEQLLYSHQTKVQETNQPRFMLNTKPMLLACGVEDRVPFNDICPATQITAPLMTATPGKALFLDKTGHSLDNERRIYFAKEITKFLKL